MTKFGLLVMYAMILPFCTTCAVPVVPIKHAVETIDETLSEAAEQVFVTEVDPATLDGSDGCTTPPETVSEAPMMGCTVDSIGNTCCGYQAVYQMQENGPMWHCFYGLCRTGCGAEFEMIDMQCTLVEQGAPNTYDEGSLEL